MNANAEAVTRFVEAINGHDVDAIAGLMTEDHVFTDSGGQQERGREAMRSGWREYFALVPDYWITVEHTAADGPMVGLFGRAGGTWAVKGKLRVENRWSVPAAWLALVRDGLVAEWRVYADLKPLYDILARLQNEPEA